MSELTEFKKFITTIPQVREDVLSKRYTWQQLYEIYTMYGEDDKFWNIYKKDTGIELSTIVALLKNVDMDSVASGLKSLEKMINMASGLLIKEEPEPKKQRYKWYDE
jgi:hypothetical protein